MSVFELHIMFGYIPTPPPSQVPVVYIYFRSYTNIHYTRKKQENKDLFVDIEVVLIIYQLILV